MDNCKEYEVQYLLLLDGELDSIEKKVIDAHLKKCSNCRNAYNKERWFRQSLKKSTPLYTASDSLRNRINSITDEYSTTPDPVLKSQPHQGLSFGMKDFKIPLKRCSYVAALMSILAIYAWLGGSQKIGPANAMTFADTAVDVHQRHTLGRLPLELVSHSPKRISNWFDGKLPFHLKLPNYQELSGQDKLYWLKGARLIGYKNDYAAYIAYQMGDHPISLVVTSSSTATPVGGEEIISKGLVIHFKSIAGLKVLTWTHHGLTYALVSDLKERGQQSCLVCHQGENLENINALGQADILNTFVEIPYSVAKRR